VPAEQFKQFVAMVRYATAAVRRGNMAESNPAIGTSEPEDVEGAFPQRRGRLQIAAVAAIAVPTFVADAVAVNTISSSEARDWTVTGLSGLGLGLVIAALWLLKDKDRLNAADWRVARLVRRLSPSREWARIATEVFLSGVVGASIAFIVHGFAPHLPAVSEAGIAVVTAILVLVVAPHVLRYGRAGLYGKLDGIAREAEGHGHDVIMEVLERNLESFSETVKGLKSESGLRMNRAEIIGWTIHCFANARGRYRGADSNVPGEYNRRYPTYLDSHRRMLERLNHGTHNAPSGERVIVATAESLRHDRVDSGKVFTHFLAWHEGRRESGNRTSVPLYSVMPRRAQQRARAHNLPSTDVALWEGQYALLFIATDDENEHVVRMCFADDKDLYTRCISYLDDLDDVKQPIDEVLNLFPEEMADAWSQYVDEPERQARVGPLLGTILAPYREARILDAAAGLGTETEWLLDNGFVDVVSNELEPQLNSRLCNRLAESGVPVEHTVANYDWRELDQRFMRGIFSVVLALGNSLCLVENVDDRRRCLAAWAKIMKRDGLLVIDERNWEYFYREKDQLLADPLRAYIPPRAMYHGTAVRSIPVAIIDRTGAERIELLFFRNGHVTSEEAARTEDHFIGTIDMFPVRNPSLPMLLNDAGFTIEKVYSDLVETEQPDPNATFYTYVARKTGG
jgi:SAM-dependent methyltransferase